MPDLRVTFPNPCHQPWGTMTPTGCHRTCAKCDKVVHDLSRYDVAEVEKLLRDEPDSCVRARLDAFGVVGTKPDRHGSIRRMVAVVGASAGLLVSPPVIARDKHIDGAIVGTAETFGFKTTATAKDRNGNSYRTKVRTNGRYKIRNVPPGTYTVEFSSDCGSTWTVEDVVVGDGQVNVAGEPGDDQRCIIVGLLRVYDAEG